MTVRKQRDAFDKDLHALVLRYMSEFDLPAEDLLEIMVREEMFIIFVAISCANEESE